MKTPPAPLAVLSKLAKRRRRTFRLAAICLVLALGECLCLVLFMGPLAHYESTRRHMLGTDHSGPPRGVGQPYLLYVPTPGFEGLDGVRHSPDGYRGETVPRKRTPGVARVLCLGGSTTYGWKVKDDSQTYPAWLERVLSTDLPPGIEGIEVINAGLPGGTSAELLTHLHFKWRYYRPDVVVLNTGGNDAFALASPHYTPDYSHYRNVPRPARTLPGPGRIVARSRLGALALIMLFHGIDLGSDELVRPRVPLAPWYQAPAGGIHEVPDDEFAFAVNLRALVREIEVTGARIVFVPFRERAGSREAKDDVQLLLERNERVMRELAVEPGRALAPFPASVIPEGEWADACHVTGLGSRAKAEHVAPMVQRLLRR